MPDWVTHLGNEEFFPLNLFFRVQGDGFWTLKLSHTFLSALFSYEPHHSRSEGGEDRRKQLNPEGLGHAAGQNNCLLRFPVLNHKQVPKSCCSWLLWASRQTSVTQQSFALWETELRVSTKTVTICYFILDVVPSKSKRTEIKSTEIFISPQSPLRTHLHGHLSTSLKHFSLIFWVLSPNP